MKKYKVIALSCGTERRRTPFEFGNIVTDEDFAPGMAEQREKEGFLQEIKEDQEPKESLLEKTPDQVSLADLANMSQEDRNAYMKKYAESLGLSDDLDDDEEEKSETDDEKTEVETSETSELTINGDKAPDLLESETNDLTDLAKKAIDGQAGEVNSDVKGQPLIDDVTKKQIMEALTEKNIPFSANDSKEILYNLMIAIK